MSPPDQPQTSPAPSASFWARIGHHVVSRCEDAITVVLDTGLLFLFAWLNFQFGEWLDEHPLHGADLWAEKAAQVAVAVVTVGTFFVRLAMNFLTLVRESWQDWQADA